MFNILPISFSVMADRDGIRVSLGLCAIITMSPWGSASKRGMERKHEGKKQGELMGDTRLQVPILFSVFLFSTGELSCGVHTSSHCFYCLRFVSSSFAWEGARTFSCLLLRITSGIVVGVSREFDNRLIS